MKEDNLSEKHKRLLAKKVDELVTQLELSQKRYIEAEQMIADIMQLPWYKRIFMSKNLLKFLNSRPHFDYIDLKNNKNNKT